MSLDLEAKIHWLETLERIRTVKHKYFIYLNKARWDDVVSYFTEDAVIDDGLGTQTSRGEITKLFQAVYVNAFEWWGCRTTERVARGFSQSSPSIVRTGVAGLSR